jgi:hypothetical protein
MRHVIVVFCVLGLLFNGAPGQNPVTPDYSKIQKMNWALPNPICEIESSSDDTEEDQDGEMENLSGSSVLNIPDNFFKGDPLKLAKVNQENLNAQRPKKKDLVKIGTRKYTKPKRVGKRRGRKARYIARVYYKPIFARIEVQKILAQVFKEKGYRLPVSSGYRSRSEQLALSRRQARMHKDNTAPVSGVKASAHLSGFAFDVPTGGMSPSRLAEIKEYLNYLASLGKVLPTQEVKNQHVLHIVAFPSRLWEEMAAWNKDYMAKNLNSPLLLKTNEFLNSRNSNLIAKKSSKDSKLKKLNCLADK